MPWCRVLVLLSCACAVQGAPVYEFNGSLWHPIPNRRLLEKGGQETITLIADASTPMAEFSALLEGIAQSSSAKQLKFQLRSQQRNALVTLERVWEVSGEAARPGRFAVIATGPGGTSLAHMDAARNEPGQRSRLDPNLEGIQSFLNTAGRIFALPGAGVGEVVPAGMVVARSNCSFGQFLNVVQLLKQSGCRKMTFEVSDFVPDPAPDILVDLDTEVDLPEVKHAGSDVDGRGRIILTIDDDAVPMDQEGKKLVDDAAVGHYLSMRRKEVEKLGLIPRLHLRTVENLHFSHVRHAIRLAAREDIPEVVFVSLVLEQLQKQIQPKAVDKDFELELPAARPQDRQPAVVPFMIRIDKEETLFTSAGEKREQLDEAGTIHLLDARLALYTAAARVGKFEPVVEIVVDGEAGQERVVEVLNALARHAINRVTFPNPVGGR